jgi:hypothetical protein
MRHVWFSLFLVSLFIDAFFAYSPTTYTLVKDYQAGTSAFFNNFQFFTGADPTHGFVQYL